MSGHDITDENLESLSLETDRRSFIKLALGALALGAASYTGIRSFLKPSQIPGLVEGASFKRGHTLLTGGFKIPGKKMSSKVVIVGAGMAGLHAGWWLKRNGFADFVILELEDEVGGKSRYKTNKSSESPLGAHYLPLPNKEAFHTIELLKEMGVLTQESANGYVFKEDYLSFAPRERLFIHGRWQEGIVPNNGIGPSQKKQMEKFFSIMEKYKWSKGKDGKFAFSIPMDLSSRDSKFLSLDKITMKDWMKAEGISNEYLDWYVNYCTLDDFGTPFDQTSAWAGIHYFAGRRGKNKDSDEDMVLTWPEGNGRIVKHLRSKLEGHIQTGKIVKKIKSSKNQVFVLVDDQTTKTVEEWSAERIIYSAPRFIAKHVIGEEVVPSNLDYSPWMVSNIVVKKPDSDPKFYWDNVNFHGRSIGYINANHMNLKSHEDEYVLTMYWPLVSDSPLNERRKALGRTHAEWTKMVMEEMETMHPGISEDVVKLDVWLWGHAMVRPIPGYIWGGEREEKLMSKDSKILFAHSDMSGMSLCEEAGYWGVKAAEEILKKS
jgi:protoporphyrinogen oxidase